MVEITARKSVATGEGELSISGFSHGGFILSVISRGRFLGMDCHLNRDELTRLGAAITDVLNTEVL
jgi:hypothetical protein